MEPIRPSKTFLRIYEPVDRPNLDSLISYLNERLTSGEYAFTYRALRSRFSTLTDYLIAYAIQLFREEFWEVEEYPQGDDTLVVFTLPKQHAA